MPRVNLRCIASSPRFLLSLVGPGLRLGLLRGIIKRNCAPACCMFCAGSEVAAVSRRDTAPSLRESQTGGTGRYNTGCVPFLLFDWRPAMVEVMKVTATSFKKSCARTAALSSSNPEAGHH
ncbi:unnamed protein product [Rangifer tarandus platyrhynchus]|uniref:Uncharacterized protein n=2 Tax=Rangifer tarandus platyrhynchus TaxID=3082113 RepID=A0AC59Z917_RANTA|nr:unnamed protein product [Rangifer tarandus platyrhynchus]